MAYQAYRSTSKNRNSDCSNDKIFTFPPINYYSSKVIKKTAYNKTCRFNGSDCHRDRRNV